MSVYFIQAGDDGPIKIGYTAGDPEKRLRALQNASAVDLRLLATIEGDQKREVDLHIEFNEHNIRGEWFAPAAPILEFVDEARANPEPPRAVLVEKLHDYFGAYAIGKYYGFCTEYDGYELVIGMAQADEDDELLVTIAFPDGRPPLRLELDEAESLFLLVSAVTETIRDARSAKGDT